MMKLWNQSTAAMFLIAVVALAIWPLSESMAQDPFGQDDETKVKMPAPTLSSGTLQAMRIREQLNKNVDLIYDSEPFGDVRAKLSEDLGINIVIDVNLEGVLDDDTEVSANLAGVNLADGLRTMLQAADATFVVKHGVLLLISIDDEYEPDYLTRQMLDARELLKLIKIAESDRIGKPVAIPAAKVRGGKSGFGGGTFQLGLPTAGKGEAAKTENVQTENATSLEYQEILTAEKILTDAIMRVVASDVWQENGSGNCDLNCIGGVLVLSSNELVAAEVRDFLNDLAFQLRNPSR